MLRPPAARAPRARTVSVGVKPGAGLVVRRGGALCAPLVLRTQLDDLEPRLAFLFELPPHLRLGWGEGRRERSGVAG